MKRVGTRLQVWRNKAKQTTGGLQKGDLTQNRHKKVVSKKASATAAKKSNLKGYLAKKRPRVIIKNRGTVVATAPRVKAVKKAVKRRARRKPRKRKRYEDDEDYRPGG